MKTNPVYQAIMPASALGRVQHLYRKFRRQGLSVRAAGMNAFALVAPY